MEEAIKVLQINAENFGAGGVSVIIWRLMKMLGGKNVQASFLSQRTKIDEKYISEIHAQGGEIHYISPSSNKLIRYFDRYRKCLKILNDTHYDIVHINGNESFGIISYVLAAKKAKCKVVIHAHSTNFMNENFKLPKRFLKLIFQPLLIRKADAMFACSNEAAKFMYGRKNRQAIIVKNGLEYSNYAFDIWSREQVRDTYKADGKMIIGHIGRFIYPKNHEFIIDVFESINNKIENAELWLIGEKEGSGYTEIYNQIYRCGLNEKVKFIGNTNEIRDYLSAMDVLIFPSRFEGLPLVMVEAQANGLPIVCSDVITDEAIFAKNVKKISLSSTADKWSEEVIKLGSEKRIGLPYQQFAESGFDISVIAEMVQDKYRALL